MTFAPVSSGCLGSVAGTPTAAVTFVAGALDEGDTIAQLAAACAGLWELGHEQLNGAVVHLAPS